MKKKKGKKIQSSSWDKKVFQVFLVLKVLGTKCHTSDVVLFSRYRELYRPEEKEESGKLPEQF